MTDPDYRPLCAIVDLPNGGRRTIDIDGRSILVLRLGNEYFAVRNKCTHLDYPLETARLVGHSLFCRKHGAQFDLRSGKALTGPAVRALDIYRTRIIDGVLEAAIPQTDTGP